MFYANGYGRAGGTTVQLSGLQAVRGEGTPVVLAGKLPVGDDEIAFGRVTAEDIGVGIGDQVELTGPTGAQTFRCTGIVVVTGLGSNEGIGEGGVVMLPGLVRLDETASIISVVVQFRPGSNGIDKYLALLATGSGDERYQPAAIANIDRVRAIPFVLAAVLAMLAVLTLAHGMITSLRSRRRDLAVLRSLGADRRFVSRAVHWQATAFATLPAVIAAPFGFVAGRTLFTGYANGIGAVNDAAVPVVIVAAIITGVVLLANIVVAMPLHRERRLTTAAILKAE